jgi:hypothetical protein
MREERTLCIFLKKQKLFFSFLYFYIFNIFIFFLLRATHVTISLVSNFLTEFDYRD